MLSCSLCSLSPPQADSQIIFFLLRSFPSPRHTAAFPGQSDPVRIPQACSIKFSYCTVRPSQHTGFFTGIRVHSWFSTCSALYLSYHVSPHISRFRTARNPRRIRDYSIAPDYLQRNNPMPCPRQAMLSGINRSERGRYCLFPVKSTANYTFLRGIGRRRQGSGIQKRYCQCQTNRLWVFPIRFPRCNFRYMDPSR